jgi:DNA mismatch endonuclease, patch repair protein
VGNHAYWSAKLARNQQRDRQKARRLRAMGWRVATIWECNVRRWSPEDLARRLTRLFG